MPIGICSLSIVLPDPNPLCILSLLSHQSNIDSLRLVITGESHAWEAAVTLFGEKVSRFSGSKHNLEKGEQ